MKFKPENGRCISYKAPDYLRSAIITTIKIYLNQSQIEIYLHHPGQFCTWSVYSFTAQKRQIYTDVSHEVKNQIQKLNQIISVLRSLTPHNVTTFLLKSFIFQIVRDTEDSEELDHCTTDSNMNYDECFYKKYHELFFAKFNCTFSFFVGYRNVSLNDSKSLSSSESHECKLTDFSEEDIEFFKSLNEGKIVD